MTYRKLSFLDQTFIHVQPGNGGSGRVSFMRSTHGVIQCADGGHGGDGGCVFLQGSHNVFDLAKLSRGRCYKAGSGGDGGSQKKAGKKGKDIIIKLPIGCEIRDDDFNHIVTINSDEKYLLAEGGKKGLGNSAFVSSLDNRSNLATKGLVKKSFKIHISLKLLFDISLVGFTNAGKSTLLRTMTRAKPEVGAYPFTTLNPQLGVLKSQDVFDLFDYPDQSIVIGDIPGLIIGASQGLGLGDDFLKHIEKSRILALVVVADSDFLVLEKTKKLNTELNSFNKSLADKKKILIISKIDKFKKSNEIKNILVSCGFLNKIHEIDKNILNICLVSSILNQGIDDLKKLMFKVINMAKNDDLKDIGQKEKIHLQSMQILKKAHDFDNNLSDDDYLHDLLNPSAYFYFD